MSLQTRLAALITAIGADIKSLQAQITALTSGSTGPWTYVVASSDVVNSTVTASSVVSTGTGLSAGKYVLEGKMWWTSAVSTTEPTFSLVFPAQIAIGAAWRDSLSIVTTSTGATITDNVATPGQTNSYLTQVEGIFTVTGTMASSLSAQIASKVASSSVTAKAGSYISYRKIA